MTDDDVLRLDARARQLIAWLRALDVDAEDAVDTVGDLLVLVERQRQQIEALTKNDLARMDSQCNPTSSSTAPTVSPFPGLLLALAEAIARNAHAGQTEESTGDDYILHVERVVGLVEGDEAKAVAWLHDVIEDSDMDTGTLLDVGIPSRIVRAVLELTRIERQPYEQYIADLKLSGDPLALAVKRADLIDHLRPNCPERLRPRYEAAMKELATGD